VQLAGERQEQWLEQREQCLNEQVREHEHAADESESLFHGLVSFCEFGFLVNALVQMIRQRIEERLQNGEQNLVAQVRRHVQCAEQSENLFHCDSPPFLFWIWIVRIANAFALPFSVSDCAAMQN
jgi:hypothetical protein